MKKVILSLIVLSGICFQLHAQKIYSTKTGQIKFNASSPLEKVAAVNDQVDSKMVDKTGQIVFSVLIKSFKFENQLMEDHFNENYMESSKFPKAEFRGYITNVTTVNFAKDGKYPVSFDGTLNIHGVQQKVTTTGVIAIEGGKPSISGSFKVKVKDYGITGSYIGSKIADEAEISVNCKYE
ncbi:MAG: YceI family protein [Bacteroidetes bacterium]|jgi:polyisoprenoid-binding protein YceI|nr:YceI family protein [Bacteroidota bacterium]